MKRIFMLLTIIIVTFTTFDTTQAANGDEGSKDLTKQEFETLFLNEITNANEEESKILEEEYKKYKNLTVEKQEKLLTYLNDEELMSQISKEFFEPGTSALSNNIITEKESFNGGNVIRNVISEDIVIEEVSLDTLSFGESPIQLADESRIATWTKSVKIFGITGMQHKSTLPYKRTKYAGWITGVSKGDHRITRNFSLNSVSYSGEIHGYDRLKAWSRVNIAISLIFKGTWTYNDGVCRINVGRISDVTGSCTKF